MAGAGYKQFADGDVLTAAQVQTYLQDQAVMKFADSSARTTGLGTAVAEGMLSYLADTDAVEVYDGSAWAQVGSDPNPGIGTAVVQAVKTDTFTTTSTSFTDVTGLAVTITPSAATSKILILVTLNLANTGTSSAQAQLLRGATAIGNAANGFASGAAGNAPWEGSLVYLDSPATTSATTYKVQVATGSGTAYVNRSQAYTLTFTSSITAIEVAA